MSDTERRPAAPEPEEETSFLSRWSRRKLQARDTGGEPLEVEPSTIRSRETASRLADPTDEPAPRELTDENMPPLESLHQDADVSMFFSAKVSPQLRRQALRRLFHAPKFNIRDGLDDFDEDYTYFAPLGDTVTADMRYMKEVAERRARELAEREASMHRPDESEPAAADAQAVAAESPVRSEASDAGETRADAETRSRPKPDASHGERSP